MPKTQYDDELKAKALEMMEKEGVSETVKKLNVKRGTLYRWQNAAKAGEKTISSKTTSSTTTKKTTKKAAAKTNAKASTKANREKIVDEARELLTKSDIDLSAKLQELTEENAKLVAENAKLKNALKIFIS